MKERLNFPNSERLKSRKDIELLFQEGEKVKKFPILLVYRFVEDSEKKVMFSVSTRTFKRAVDRNRIKRQMREVYRLHRKEWFENETRGLHFCFIYLSRGKLELGRIKERIMDVMSRSNINYTNTET